MTATLEIKNLCVDFGALRALDGVSLRVNRGKILGLVGESGSGKSVTGMSILKLLETPGKITSGQVLFDGHDLVGADDKSMRKIRGNRISMIFQDPMMTLNPVLRVGTQMVEAVLAHEKTSKVEAVRRARDALGAVGIGSPEERLAAYPHQFSGGMRQRVVIAIALLHKPDLIVADEPTTALDVTIQAQILSEIQKLTRERNTALIWISHDLSVVAGLADEIAVMYSGKVVETGSTDAVLDKTLHPYTHGLIGSVPSRNLRGRRLHQIPGVTPSIDKRPSGCPFHPRCRKADEMCTSAPPVSEPEPGHVTRCFHPITRQSKVA
ncbi:MAG: ABC transporter ATP-binding protein [Roseibium sp.]|uniref:ABC transporter ATP-binding protein n=1 Tax=Roseibium sp. TaxID=1936156 RepID=UPI00260FFC0D|nr:ABC transporter ATP-binding protein [Roseibium sp.]MCV0425897.1 ABC transporter ATP-binding protein [Roseibium sp.]